MSPDDKPTGNKLTGINVRELLGPPPLLSGESAEHYDQLFDRVAEPFGAGDDVILSILSKRFTDNTWENARYGRQRTVSIERRARQSLDFQNERKQKQK